MANESATDTRDGAWADCCAAYYHVTEALAALMQADRSIKRDPEARQRWLELGATMEELKAAMHAHRDAVTP